jgi:hypothetical protein
MVNTTHGASREVSQTVLIFSKLGVWPEIRAVDIVAASLKPLKLKNPKPGFKTH